MCGGHRHTIKGKSRNKSPESSVRTSGFVRRPGFGTVHPKPDGSHNQRNTLLNQRQVPMTTRKRAWCRRREQGDYTVLSRLQPLNRVEYPEGTRPLLQTNHPSQRHTIERAFTAQFAVKRERNGVPHPTVDWLLFPFRQNANINGRSEPE